MVIHANKFGCRTRLLERLCDHDGNGLVVMVNFRATEQFGRVFLAFTQRPGVFGGDNRNNACGFFGGGKINQLNTAFSNRRAYYIAIRRIGLFVMPLVGIMRGAGGFQRAVDTVMRLADHVKLVDRVLFGRIFRFHRLIPSLPSVPRRGCASPAAT
ncbi:hypothetical protein D3C75_538840 [compost metagenome]